MVGDHNSRDESVDQNLIDEYIELDPDRPVLSEARLARYGVPVWALVGYLEAVDGNETCVAEAYEVPVDAVRAAIAYYRLQKPLIDARLAANAA